MLWKKSQAIPSGICMIPMHPMPEEEAHRQIVTLWVDTQAEVTTMVLMMATHTEVHMMDMI